MAGSDTCQPRRRFVTAATNLARHRSPSRSSATTPRASSRSSRVCRGTERIAVRPVGPDLDRGLRGKTASRREVPQALSPIGGQRSDRPTLGRSSVRVCTGGRYRFISARADGRKSTHSRRPCCARSRNGTHAPRSRLDREMEFRPPRARYLMTGRNTRFRYDTAP